MTDKPKKTLIIDTGNKQKDLLLERVLDKIKENTGMSDDQLAEKFANAIQALSSDQAARVVTLEEYAKIKAEATGRSVEECLNELNNRQPTVH